MVGFDLYKIPNLGFLQNESSLIFYKLSSTRNESKLWFHILVAGRTKHFHTPVRDFSHKIVFRLIHISPWLAGVLTILHLYFTQAENTWVGVPALHRELHRGRGGLCTTYLSLPFPFLYHSLRVIYVCEAALNPLNTLFYLNP